MLPGSITTSAACLARERTLPVHPTLVPLFAPAAEVPGALPGLVRGHTVACVGTAAMSCALALAATPSQAGSWVGVVGVPEVGIAAAQHLGVALERLVFIAVSRPMSRPVTRPMSRPVPRPAQPSANGRSDLVGALSALVDGVDMVLLADHLVASLSSAILRSLQTRAQSRGTVLVVVGDPGTMTVDLRLSTRSEHWQGIGWGHGHLRRRLVSLELDGRRCGRPRQHAVWLPGDRGELAAVSAGDVSPTARSADGRPVHDDAAVVVPLRRTG